MSSKVNRGRTLARSQALQILFQAEALDKPVDAVLAGDYLLSKGPLDDYAVELARGAYEQPMPPLTRPSLLVWMSRPMKLTATIPLSSIRRIWTTNHV